jgi:hypothetical protein
MVLSTDGLHSEGDTCEIQRKIDGILGKANKQTAFFQAITCELVGLYGEKSIIVLTFPTITNDSYTDSF